MSAPWARPALIRASAGTGKTYQLVEAYAGLVVGGCDPRRVVAITFTDRAAAELRGRIAARLGRPLDAEALPVGTFHALCLALLAKAAGDPGGERPRVLDGQEAQATFVAAAHAAWFAGDARARADTSLVAPHLDVGGGFAEELFSALCRAREQGAQSLRGLWHQAAPAAAAAAAHRALTAFAAGLAREAQRPGLSATSADKVRAFAARVPAAPPSADHPAPWAAAWRAALGGLDARGGLRQLWDGERRQELLAAVGEVEAEALWRRLRPAVARLAGRAWRGYRARKQAAGCHDFTDLLARAAHLLARDEGPRAAWGGPPQAVLVDEGQDTNPLQRSLVRLLVGLEGPGRRAPPACLVVVGDPKQAIYTFRGADAAAFGRFAEDVDALAGDRHTLTVSWRTEAPLVAAINHLGEHLLGAGYDPLAARPRAPRSAPAGGLRWCQLAADADASGQAAVVASLVQTRLEAASAPASVAVLLATRQSMARVAAALRAARIPYALRDAGLLSAQPLVLDLLALLRFLAAPHSRMAAAVALRAPALALGDDAITELLAAGDAREVCLPAAPPAALTPIQQAAWRRWRPSWDAWRSDAYSGPVAPLLQALDAGLELVATYTALGDGDLVAAAWERLVGLAQDFDQAPGGTALEFVVALEAQAARGAGPSLGASTPAAAAVTLATIHQSKGLEFDVVVLPFIGQGRRRVTASVLMDAERGLVLRPRLPGVAAAAAAPAAFRAAAEAAARGQDDELARLVYVAVTRARREVIVVDQAPTAALREAGRGLRPLLWPWWAPARAAGVLSVIPPPASGGAQAPACAPGPPAAVVDPGWIRRGGGHRLELDAAGLAAALAGEEVMADHRAAAWEAPAAPGALAADELDAWARHAWRALPAALWGSPPPSLAQWLAARLGAREPATAGWARAVAEELAGQWAAACPGAQRRRVRWRRRQAVGSTVVVVHGEADLLVGAEACWSVVVHGHRPRPAVVCWSRALLSVHAWGLSPGGHRRPAGLFLASGPSWPTGGTPVAVATAADVAAAVAAWAGRELGLTPASGDCYTQTGPPAGRGQ